MAKGISKRVARFFVLQHTKTGKNTPNKIYQMTTKYTYQMAVKRPNGHEKHQQLQLQDPPKFTQTGILGLKTNHLATLISIAGTGIQE
jgi:hypothetical protein